MATSGDFLLATGGDFFMATDNNITGARTWCGHSVCAHNLSKIGALTA
jgi:hypothetical protein